MELIRNGSWGSLNGVDFSYLLILRFRLHKIRSQVKCAIVWTSLQKSEEHVGWKFAFVPARFSVVAVIQRTLLVALRMIQIQAAYSENWGCCHGCLPQFFHIFSINWVFPKIGKHPEMDGENNGKPYFKMGYLGGKPTIFGNIQFPDNANWAATEKLLTLANTSNLVLGNRS